MSIYSNVTEQDMINLRKLAEPQKSQRALKIKKGVGDRKSNRKTFFIKTLPKLVEEIQNKTFEEITDDSDDLQGEGVKIIIPSNTFDIYTRLEVLLGLKLSGHTDTLTEASNLIDELYKRGEKQNEQQYRNALDKF